MRDNKGFSLLEVLIVMVILGIVAGIGIRQIGVVFGYSAREARTKIEASINSLKVSALSKSKGTAKSVYDDSGVLDAELDVYLKIYKNDKGLYYAYLYERTTKDGIEKENGIEKELAPRKIDISYSYAGDTSGTKHSVGDSNSPLILAYNRSTGGFLQQDKTSGKQIQYIYCSTEKKEYRLKLMPTTGKVVLD